MASQSILSGIAVFLAVTSCQAEKNPRPAQVVVRWIQNDLTIANMAPTGILENWQVITGTNEGTRPLKRYGGSLDGHHLCTVTENEELFVRPVSSTISFPTSAPLGTFEVDGCIVDRHANVLAYWRSGNRIRTFALESNGLELVNEITFDNGPLGGPATTAGSSSTDLAIVDSPFSRIEAWVSRSEGWQRGMINVEEGQLISFPSAIGNLVVMVALSQEPAVIILRLTPDGQLEARTWIDTPEVVQSFTVAPDDRYAWMWSATTAYVLELETGEVYPDMELSDCAMLTPAAVETTSGYVIVGVRNEEERRELGRCSVGDDGRFEAYETSDVPPPGYGDDSVLSLRAVFLR
jgi:hypothetical protein